MALKKPGNEIFTSIWIVEILLEALLKNLFEAGATNQGAWRELET